MRLNPFKLLKGLWSSANAKTPPSAPANDALLDSNPFSKAPVQPTTAALPIPANAYSCTPLVANPATAIPVANGGGPPIRDYSFPGSSVINSLPPGLNLPSSANAFAKAPAKRSNEARPIPANAYSYLPPTTPFTNAAFPVYDNGMNNDIHNVPTSKIQITQPCFSSTSASDACSTSSAGTIDIDMTDAAPAQAPTPPVTPPTPPPDKPNTPVHPNPRHATVETVEDDPSTSSTDSNTRPKLQPKRQHERRTASHPRRDYAAEITYEEDDGDLPEGYLGTWKGARWYSPDYGVYLPCMDGLHHLSCNHWVTTDEQKPCGLNCHNPNFKAAPFACPTCRHAVQGVIENQLSEKEKAKVDQAIAAGEETYLVGFLVEFVSKRVQMKANITETVISIVRTNKRERDCHFADPPKIARSAPLEQQVKEYYEWKAERKLAARNPPNATKRKQEAQLVPPIIKKPKHKLTDDDEPPAQDPRGTKRQSTSSDLSTQKKTQTAPPVQYGDVRYATPRASAISPLVRKRDGEVETEVDGIKRVKKGLARAGDGEMPVFEGDGEEEL